MPTSLDKTASPFHQGGRKGWVLTMNVRELTEIAPKREERQLSLMTETNRPITVQHRNSIERFVETNHNWAMPSISLSAGPGVISAADGRIQAEAGRLEILDGQHRIEAFNNLINQMEADAAREPGGPEAARLKALTEEELPVVIYEVQNTTEHRQLFSWMARQRPIEKAVAEFFDDTDPFGRAAKRAMEDSKTLVDRVTWRYPSVPKRGEDSTKLLTLRQLKEIATTMTFGTGKAPTTQQKNTFQEPDKERDIGDRLIAYFDNFLPNCLPNYTNLTGNVRGDRNSSYALHYDMIRLTANVWARWTGDRGREPGKLTRLIAGLNLKPADAGNAAENGLGIIVQMRSGPKFRNLRDPQWTEATRILLEMTEATA